MSFPIPSSQRALKIQGPGELEVVDNCPIPQMEPDEVLVRVAYVAINPVDGKSADLSPTVGATSGCDFAGEVVRIGAAVRKPLCVGDRVSGCVFGNNPDRLDNGAFAEYVAVPGELVVRLPPEMSFKAGASLGVGLTTVGLALFHALALPLPPSVPAATADRPCFVLVYGGGTATGGLAIQMARRSGLVPLAVCSPRSFERVKALGAVAAFDYRSPTCAADIRAFSRNSLAHAFDCITDSGSMRICYGALSSRGGKYLALDPFPIRGHTRRNVRPNWIIAFTVFNRPISWKRPYQKEARPKDRAFAGRWLELAEGMLADGAIEPHPVQARGGGLDGVVEGVDLVRKGEVAGVKLVYRIAGSAAD